MTVGSGQALRPVGMGMLVVIGGIVKFDLKTLAKVKSVKVDDGISTGFAYNGYGYFGGI